MLTFNLKKGLKTIKCPICGESTGIVVRVWSYYCAYCDEEFYEC